MKIQLTRKRWRECIHRKSELFGGLGSVHASLCGERDMLQSSSKHDVYNSFGGVTPSCREGSRPRGEAGSTILGATTEGTVIGPVLQFNMLKISGKLWNWNRNSFTDSFRAKFLGYVVPRNETQNGRSTCSKVGIQQRQQRSDYRKSSWKYGTVSYRVGTILHWGNSCYKQSESLEEAVCQTQSTIPIRERKWEVVPGLKGHHTPLNTANSMFVMILRHCDQEERDSDGAMYWDLIQSSLLEDFGSRVGQNYDQQDWLQAIHEGSNKTRFEYCNIFFVKSPELMGHVKIPYDWKEI